MTRSFGDTQWHGGARWGGADRIRWGDDLPVSVADALDRTADENDPSTWTISGTEPPQQLAVETAGVETVTISQDTLSETTSFSVSGAATTGEVVAAAALVGLTVTASGGPLGTAKMMIGFPDFGVDSSGAVRWTTPTLAGGPVRTELYRNLRVMFRIEIYNKSTRKSVRELSFLQPAKLTAVMSKQSELEFRIANPDADLVTALTNVKDNGIRVIDRYGMTFDTFNITAPSREHKDDAVFWTFYCANQFSDLAACSPTAGNLPYVQVESDDPTVTNYKLKVKDLIDALKTYMADADIAVGEIDPRIGDTEIEAITPTGSVLQILREVQSRLPYELQGRMSLSGYRTFSWLVPSDVAQTTIKIGERLQSLKVEYDYSAIVNQIIPITDSIGAGSVHLHNFGTPIRNEESIANYGLRSKQVNVTDKGGIPYAIWLLQHTSVPKPIYTLGVLDLAKADTQAPTDRAWTPDGVDGCWEDLIVGARYYIDDPVLGVSAVPVRMTSIVYDLAHPLKTQCEFNFWSPELSEAVFDSGGGGGGGGGGTTPKKKQDTAPGQGTTPSYDPEPNQAEPGDTRHNNDGTPQIYSPAGPNDLDNARDAIIEGGQPVADAIANYITNIENLTQDAYDYSQTATTYSTTSTTEADTSITEITNIYNPDPNDGCPEIVADARAVAAGAQASADAAELSATDADTSATAANNSAIAARDAALATLQATQDPGATDTIQTQGVLDTAITNANGAYLDRVETWGNQTYNGVAPQIRTGIAKGNNVDATIDTAFSTTAWDAELQVAAGEATPDGLLLNAQVNAQDEADTTLEETDAAGRGSAGYTAMLHADKSRTAANMALGLAQGAHAASALASSAATDASTAADAAEVACDPALLAAARDAAALAREAALKAAILAKAAAEMAALAAAEAALAVVTVQNDPDPDSITEIIAQMPGPDDPWESIPRIDPYNPNPGDTGFDPVTEAPGIYDPDRNLTIIPDPYTGTPAPVAAAGSPGTSGQWADGTHEHAGLQLSAEIAQPIAADGAAGSTGLASDAGHVHAGLTIPAITLALLSDAVPNAVGAVGMAGVSELGSRSDHVHEGSLLTGSLSDDVPEPVGETGSAGTSELVSRADHVHEGGATVAGTIQWLGTLTAHPTKPTSGKAEWYLSTGTPPQCWQGSEFSTEATPMEYATEDSGEFAA